MNRILTQIWNDMKNGENIDLYLTVFVSMIVSLLGLLKIVESEIIMSLTLTVLALLAYSSLKSRHRAADDIKSQSEVQFLFSNPSPVQEERLRVAKTISHNGITLVGSSNTLLNVFSDCVAGGGKVRLIVVDPDSVAIEIAAQRFSKHQDAAKLKREVKHSLDNFASIASQSCEVQLLEAMPPFSLWIIDEDNPRAEIWLGLYPFRGETEPWLKIFPQSNREMFGFLVNQFTKLWEASRPWNAQQTNTTHLRK